MRRYQQVNRKIPYNKYKSGAVSSTKMFMHIGFKKGGKARFMEPFHTFPPNTHTHYSLK
jgi:hypothetical protein